MKLREIMSSPVLTLSAAEPASDAFAAMRDADVRHAVVVSGPEVIGVVSDRDLGGPDGGLVRKGKSVADLMRRDVVHTTSGTSVTEAVGVVRERRIGCLPIVDDGRLVGIVTRGDLLDALSKRRRRDRVRAAAAEIPRAPRLASPNRDKSP